VKTGRTGSEGGALCTVVADAVGTEVVLDEAVGRESDDEQPPSATVTAHDQASKRPRARAHRMKA
jgi:hypothetical protein